MQRVNLTPFSIRLKVNINISGDRTKVHKIIHSKTDIYVQQLNKK